MLRFFLPSFQHSLVSRAVARFLFGLVTTLIATQLFAKGVDPHNNKITLSLTAEPPSMDSSLSTDVTSGMILAMINEGLVKLGRRGEAVPGMAESWEQDGLEVTFKIRDALWSDGQPVTAHDFEFAFKRLVNPETGAAGSTFFAYIIEHAEDILAGKREVNELSAKALDDKTFWIRLSRPAPYFLTVLTGSAWRPLREDFVLSHGQAYGAEADTILFNGPFRMTGWTHSASLQLAKNPTYWDQSAIPLDDINFGYITADTRSLLNLYKTDQLAALRLNEEILKDAMNSGIRVQRATTNCVSWIMMNMHPDRITSNLKIRQAIRFALDRDRYANNIVGLPGTKVVDSAYSTSIRGINAPFIQEFPPPRIEYHPDKGRQLIEEAKAELGIDEIPPIVMVINETRQIEAEYVQSQLINALGLDVRVDKQTFKQSLVKFRQGDFDIARQGFCGGVLTDPVFFAGIFTTTSAFNDLDFSNARYDDLMEITHYSSDQNERMQAFKEMQQILFDEAPIIPTIESAWVYVQDRQVRGLKRFPNTDFTRARIVGRAQ
jgi:oligopeptide transport system substrate-binding protein